MRKKPNMKTAELILDGQRFVTTTRLVNCLNNAGITGIQQLRQALIDGSFPGKTRNAGPAMGREARAILGMSPDARIAERSCRICGHAHECRRG